jgi:hypothetical protein
VAGELPQERTSELLGTHEEGGRIVSLEVQRPRAPSAPTVTVAVRGTVRTPTGAPVPGARAFLSGTGHSSVTDREGQFAMLDVPAARYRLSFTHPRFDTLGIVADVVEVDANVAAEHQLKMPTDEEITRSACSVPDAAAPDEAPTLLYGYVREASSPAVVPEATVTVAWRRSLPRGPTVGVRNETLEALTDATGRYQVCGAPRETSLSIRATRGSRRGSDQRIDPLASLVNRLDVELVQGRP